MADTRGPVTSAITIMMVVLATVFVAGRIFTRAYLVRRIGADDWTMLAAWLVSVAFSITICLGVRYGLGQHQGDIPSDQLSSLRKTEYVFSVLYNPSLMLTKTSICIFYLSVMSKDVDPIFKWSTWLTMAVTNVAGAALTFFNLFHCTPIYAAWQDPMPAGATCTNIVTLFLASAPVNIITDLAILFLPMPILTGMRLPKKQKIILVFTFGFGAFIAVVDVIRIAYLQQAALARLTAANTGNDTNSSSRDTEDFSWNASLSFMWSAVEVNLGIICACVPALKPLFMKFLPHFIRSDGDPASQNNSLISKNSIDEGNAVRIHLGNRADNALAKGGNGQASPINNPAAFRRPSTKEYAGEDDGDQMGFLNMLAGPDDDAPQLNRTSTRTSTMKRPARPTRNMSHLSRSSTTKSTTSDFGFVKMDKNRNMLKLSNRQSIWPIAVVTIIFFLWGFAYGLLASLNGQFQKVVTISERESLGLHASYYAGYFVGPLTLGRFMLKRYGFKATMMAGLCVYGCGTLVFWPSAVLTSYTAFIISNFIVASGLACLEIAANPYIALCGPLEYAEVRLNLSQAFQAVGTVCSPLLAEKALFHDLNGNSLIDVQWTYLGIALFVIGLAVAFYYIPLPEASDDQLEELADKRSAAYRAKIGPYKVVYVTLVIGVFSQWLYVGGQEVVGSLMGGFMQLEKPNDRLTDFDYITVAHTVFAIGRFMSAFLNYLFTPRWILLGLQTGLVISTGFMMSTHGDTAAAVAQLVYFFEAGIFSIIYAISMRGLGAHTKTGSAFMSAAISGGAVWPVFQWAVKNARGFQFSYSIPLAAFAIGMIFPLYLNLLPQARNQVDPVHEKRIARRARRAEQRSNSVGSETMNPHLNDFGIVGIIARKRRADRRSQKQPFAEHVESASLNSPMSPNMFDEKASSTLIGSPPTAMTRDPNGGMGTLSPWPNDGMFHNEKQRYVEDEDSDSPNGSGGLDYNNDDEIGLTRRPDTAVSPKTVQKNQFQHPAQQKSLPPLEQRRQIPEPAPEEELYQIKSALEEDPSEEEDDDESDLDEYDYHSQFRKVSIPNRRPQRDIEHRSGSRSYPPVQPRVQTTDNPPPPQNLPRSPTIQQLWAEEYNSPPPKRQQQEQQQARPQSQLQTQNLPQSRSRELIPDSPDAMSPKSTLPPQTHSQPQARSQPPPQSQQRPKSEQKLSTSNSTSSASSSAMSPTQTRKESHQEQDEPNPEPPRERRDPALHNFDEEEIDDDGYDEYHSHLRRL